MLVKHRFERCSKIGGKIMRKNFGSKPYLYPMPVLIIGTYDENDVPNSISMAPHKTTDNILLNHDFTVSMATEDYVKACDYVGIESGNKVENKFVRAGFHAIKSEFVNAPVIAELPMCLECRMKSFQDEILIGEIINVNAEESILTDGKIDAQKLKPITYDPIMNTYIGLGKMVGNAFKDGLDLK